MTSEFGVDIPHMRSAKSKAFGAEKGNNTMRYQFGRFRATYLALNS